MNSTAFRRVTCLLVFCLLWLGWLASRPVAAASVSAPEEAGPAAPPPVGPQVLDRALTGDVTGGSKNVDLLLEMRRNDAAEAGRPAAAPIVRPAARPAGLAADTALTVPSAVPVTVPPPLPDLPPRGLVDADRALGLPQGAAAGPSARWGGGDAADAGGPAVAERSPPAPALAGELKPYLRLPGQLLHALRDYRYWLLGAIALAFALGAAYKKFNRRI